MAARYPFLLSMASPSNGSSYVYGKLSLFGHTKKGAILLTSMSARYQQLCLCQLFIYDIKTFSIQGSPSMLSCTGALLHYKNTRLGAALFTDCSVLYSSKKSLGYALCAVQLHCTGSQARLCAMCCTLYRITS